jgi:hypothetical protein
MRSKIAQHSLLSLSQEERKTFMERLAALPNGETMTRLGEFLLESEVDTDRDLSRRFHLSQYDREKYLKEIGKILLSVLNEGQASPSKTFDLARRLVRHSYYDAAIEIIESGIHQASAEGHYQMVLWFWDLVDFFHVTPTIRAMQRKEARRHLKDITKFNKWISKLEKARSKATVESRIATLEALKQKATARAAKHNLSLRAHYKYLKLLSLCHLMLSEVGMACSVQKSLVDYIKDQPHACLDPEFSLIKETKTLSQVYWITKQIEEFNQSMERLANLPAVSRHAQYEKIYARFPFIIAVAIEQLDSKAGNEACMEFFRLMEDERYSFPPFFLTECLYYCAYFYLFSGQRKSLSRSFTVLKRYSRSDFKLKFYLLSQFLRVLDAIEQREWEDATTFSNNLRRTKGLEVLSGLTTALDFLIGMIKDHSAQTSQQSHAISSENSLRLKDILLGLELLSYFDLPVWMDSLANGCKLIEPSD